jgi:MFS family permease
MLHKVKEQISSFLPALRSKNYRYYFVGQGISLIGSWMQMIAEQWLVYPILTTNKSLLGLIGAIGMLPMLFFVLFAGVLVDRFNKRNMFLLFQYVYTAIALTLFILIATGHIQLWHIFVAALISGTIMAFESPTRMTFVMDLVDKKDLPSALALHWLDLQLRRLALPLRTWLTESVFLL